MARTGMNQDQIRDKAIDLTIVRMRKEGFEKVRLVDIAKDLGVSHAALYGHFTDKSDLLDAVSERWLVMIDNSQEVLCQKKIDPLLKMRTWFLNLHRYKREKVLNDPELYKAFDASVEHEKPFVKTHLENMHRQLLLIVNEAIAAKKIKKDDAELSVQIILTAMMPFSHPKLVVQFINEKRETLLKQTLDTVLVGLK